MITPRSVPCSWWCFLSYFALWLLLLSRVYKEGKVYSCCYVHCGAKVVCMCVSVTTQLLFVNLYACLCVLPVFFSNVSLHNNNIIMLVVPFGYIVWWLVFTYLFDKYGALRNPTLILNWLPTFGLDTLTYFREKKTTRQIALFLPEDQY